MIELTDEIKNRQEPVAVLTVWRNESSGSRFLETSKVLKDGTLGVPKPVSRKFMENIARTFSREYGRTPHGAVPDNLLLADTRPGQERYVWWEPPGKRTQTFGSQIALEDGEYMFPGTVYSVTGDRLSVYAFAGSRPSPRKRLLYGPFFNYYTDGGICLGSARLPLPEDLTWRGLMDHWESLFWNSENSHLIENPVHGNLVTILKQYRDEPFNTTVLRRTKLHLGDLLA